MALIERDGQTTHVHRGDSVAEGWTLDKIESDSIVLVSDGGQSTTLRLFESIGSPPGRTGLAGAGPDGPRKRENRLRRFPPPTDQPDQAEAAEPAADQPPPATPEVAEGAAGEEDKTAKPSESPNAEDTDTKEPAMAPEQTMSEQRDSIGTAADRGGVLRRFFSRRRSQQPQESRRED